MLRILAVLLVASCVLAGCPFSSSKRIKPASHFEFGSKAPPAPSPYPDWAGSLPGAVNTSDPFVAMNNYFFTMYSASGNSLRPQPIVVIEDDYIVLHYNGQRILEPAETMKYHNLKMVSHVPLAIFMTLLTDLYGKPQNETVQLSATTVATLKTYSTFANAAYANLIANPARFDKGDQYERQVAIFTSALGFLSNVLNTGECSLFLLGNMTYSLLPQLSLNLNEAAADSVDRMYAVMEQWRTTVIAPEDWPTLRAIAATSHMARRASMYSQFFARYFNVDIIQSDKFITLEELSSEDAVFVLLDTHVTDYAIGDLFFHDHFRMHQDALCGGAKIALDRIFPDTANTTQGCYND